MNILQEHVEELLEHLGATAEKKDLKNTEFWQKMCDSYPQFFYTGIGFRALDKSKEQVDIEELVSIGTSYSKTKSGNDYFIDSYLSNCPVVIFEVMLKGFDVESFLRYILKNFRTYVEDEIGSVNEFIKEEEVVLVCPLNTPHLIEERENPSFYYSENEELKRKNLYKGYKSPF